jgi:hypothetical protein
MRCALSQHSCKTFGGFWYQNLNLHTDDNSLGRPERSRRRHISFEVRSCAAIIDLFSSPLVTRGFVCATPLLCGCSGTVFPTHRNWDPRASHSVERRLPINGQLERPTFLERFLLPRHFACYLSQCQRRMRRSM